MRTICPNCRYTVERPGIASSEEIVCPACGATYRLDSGGTETWSPGDRRVGPSPHEQGDSKSARPSLTMSSSRSWVLAGWGWCTRPKTRAWGGMRR